jgi:hypothetical protein
VPNKALLCNTWPEVVVAERSSKSGSAGLPGSGAGSGKPHERHGLVVENVEDKAVVKVGTRNERADSLRLGKVKLQGWTRGRSKV